MNMPAGMEKHRQWLKRLASSTCLSRIPCPGWRWHWLTGWILSLGCFAAGLVPSRNQDPFGLRRAAIGVVQPLIEHGIAFNLQAAVESAAALQPIPVADEVQAQVLEFITGRLRVVLVEMGLKHDAVDAVLAVQSDDPAGALSAPSGN